MKKNVFVYKYTNIHTLSELGDLSNLIGSSNVKSPLQIAPFCLQVTTQPKSISTLKIFIAETSF